MFPQSTMDDAGLKFGVGDIVESVLSNPKHRRRYIVTEPGQTASYIKPVDGGRKMLLLNRYLEIVAHQLDFDV